MSKYLLIFIFSCSYLINLTCSTVDLKPLINTSEVAVSCQAGEFLCSSTECIPATNLCDGTNDCVDGSDETICPIRCTVQQFQCGAFNCIPRKQVCDGVIQCYDGSDEAKCVFSCKAEEFKCDDGRCIGMQYRCDGKPNCGDYSDERDCGIVSTFDCNRNEFTCNSTNLCVNYKLLCNGVNDCQNGEDEVACPFTKQPEPPNYWELAAWVGGSIAVVVIIICLVFIVKGVMNKSQNMYA